LRIRWAHLYRVLRANSAFCTAYDRSLEALEQDAHGRLVPVFRRGSEQLVRDGAFDMLVAADGRYSRLRELGRRNAALHLSRHRHMAACGARRRLESRSTTTAIFLRQCPVLSFRLPNDCVYVAGSFPLEGSGPVPDYLKTRRAQRRFFQSSKAKSVPEVEWMLTMVDRHIDDMNWARTQEIETKHQALGGRVLLLGDAAHAMFQTLGQGATQAIEDALAAGRSAAHGAGNTARCCAPPMKRAAATRANSPARFTREATDTLLPGTDPVEGSLAKAQEPFLAKLRKLYLDVM
jgi:salicylate hydroxylase